MSISVIILTFNSADSIKATLESAALVSDDIHVVDSFSTDDTSVIARSFDINFVQRPFENYGAQRNWAIGNLNLKYDWELHLDADERLGDDLANEINRIKPVLARPGGGVGAVDGYYIPRLVHFMGRPIRHGGMYPIWHMRLFRHGKGQCENRRYDQHFVVQGRTARIPHPMMDDIRMPLGEWVTRHAHWADAEAEEILNPGKAGVIAGRFLGSPVERKRFLRGFYNHQPLFLRAFLLFFYRYILRLGFLDGRHGLIFFVLQTFWFRFLVDAKIYERRLARKDADNQNGGEGG